jgi:predicted dehydrogenase
VGIAGAGLMGRWHAAAAVRAGADVAAVLDPRPEPAAALARTYDAAAHTDLDRMLSDTALDVLHVCTPLDTHRDLVARAIAAGLHVLAEKPLTPDAAGTEALLAEARAAGRLLCPVHQFPFQRGAQAALRHRTRLGTLLGFDAAFHSAGAEGRSDRDTDAVVADILPHPISLMQALLPDGTDASGWQAIRPCAGELAVSAIQREATVSIRISMGARPTVARLRLYGTEGTAHLDLFHGYVFFESGGVSRAWKIAAPFERAGRDLAAAAGNIGRRIVHWEPAYPGLRELIARFYGAARGDAPPPFSDTEILEAARLRDRLVRAAGLLHPA